MAHDAAIDDLAAADANVLREFAASGLSHLRLLPLSGGVFAGKFRDDLPAMTAEALGRSFTLLTNEQQRSVLSAQTLDLCIFFEKDLRDYTRAVVRRKARENAPGRLIE